MTHLLISLSFFAASVIAHIGWCRRHKAKRLHIISFGLIALLGFSLFLALAGHLPAGDGGIAALPLSASVLYFLLVPVYLIIYFGTKVESPSRRILQILEAQGAVSLPDLERQITHEDLLMPRLRDLVRLGYMENDGQNYILTAKGLRVARGLALYRQWTGRDIGG